MARTKDQARWRKGAEGRGRKRIEVWLPVGLIRALDAFPGSRGRSEKIGKLIRSQQVLLEKQSKNDQKRGDSTAETLGTQTRLHGF